MFILYSSMLKNSNSYWFIIIIFIFIIQTIILKSELTKANFTIVVLPDTQYYSAYYKDTFFEQTNWCCSCQNKLNISFVSHLGDIVEHDNEKPKEWIVAKKALYTLLKCDIPHGFLPGNHDVNYNIKNEQDINDAYSMFDLTFKLEDYKSKSWFGYQVYSNKSIRNNFQLFTAKDKSETFLYFHIEFFLSPILGEEKNSIIRWMNNIILLYPYRSVIIATHFVISDCKNNYYIQEEFLWLMKKHCNILFIFGAHSFKCGGERIVKIKNNCKQNRFIFVTNYQNRDPAKGWLRYYYFTKDKICAFTYSTQKNRFQFENDLSYFSINRLNMTLGDGCPYIKKYHYCKSNWNSFSVLAFVIMSTIINYILQIYFILV